jgi:tRNA(Ile)-lysidine synthase
MALRGAPREGGFPRLLNQVDPRRDINPIKLRGMTTAAAFRKHVGTLGLQPGAALVAVSGGPDSVALLDLLVRSRDAHGQDLVVAHVDHGIHPASADVARQVAALAESYGLVVEIGRLALGIDASETKARAERYAWLEMLRARLGASYIFTGHHGDDQVETVLMRFLAGSGPAGLAGMAVINGRVVRPLLPFSRADLIRHLEEAALEAWVDPANSDRRHLRSWLRADLLPVLRARLPKVDASILRTTRQAARDRAAWDALLDVLPDLDLAVEPDGISVAAPSLDGYDSPLAHALILAVARRAGCQLGPARLSRVAGLLQVGTSGTRVPLGGGWIAELAFGRLRLCRIASGIMPGLLALEGESGEATWGPWRFRWSPAVTPEHQERAGLTAWFSSDSLLVRAWSAGEKLKPLGGTGRRLVVRCFQEMRVPRSRRDSWPVVAQHNQIIWIPGVCRSDAQLPSRGSEAVRVDAEYA